MAKLYLTIAVIFLFLFAFSNARTVTDSTLTEVVGDNSLNTLSESDIPEAASTILLPSERRQSEPVKLVELEPESIDPNFAEFRTGESSPQDSESSSYSVPLTVISFRPINRHFPRRPFPLSSFRHGHRCRHGHPQFKPWGPRPLRREVSYGNDMLVAGEEPKSKPVFGDEEEPQIRTRMIRFRQGGPRFPFRHDEDQTERPNHHHRDHDHGDDHDHDHDHGDDHDHDHDHHHHLHVFHRHHMEMEGGQTKEREVEKEHKNHAESFMKSFRKFLNRF